jgi:hypothetical protein
MPQATPDRGQELREIRRDLVKANDDKIRQIVAVLDNVVNPDANQAVLDPIRARLGSLKPARPLRFARLFSTPVDPLIVPARDWKSGDPAIPRTVLASLARVVHSRLGDEASVIEAMIAGHMTDAVQAITSAGELLWPRAAEILVVAVPPLDWPETGLRPAVFTDLAHAMAAVLRRAPQLRRLARQDAIGALPPEEQAVSDILVNIANEPAVARAMIIRLILRQSPHATPVLRHIVATSLGVAEKALVRQAMSSATDNVLTDLESGSHITDEIGRGSLADAGDGVRRVIALLAELEIETDAVRHRPRLHAIRGKLDEACRARFEAGVREGLVAPLGAAGGPVDGSGQNRLETSARELRALETVARKVGGSASYDQMLPAATEAVKAAAVAGNLTPMRTIRLIEILAGPEAAEAYYTNGRNQ